MNFNKKAILIKTIKHQKNNKQNILVHFIHGIFCTYKCNQYSDISILYSE